jgi:hypothetical protein
MLVSLLGFPITRSPPQARTAIVSKRFLFETQRILPISGHKEALQVKLPGGLMKETQLGMVIEITGVGD